MAAETELKLRIEARDATRVGRLPWLAGCPAKTIRLGNLYYDTPERDLAGRGMAVRHRVIGRRWFVTVKSREASTGGLAVRREWEYPCAPGILDFSGVEDAALRRHLEQLAPRLTPRFSTDFRRRYWLFAPHEALAVEVAVDQGRIVCGERSEPISEVELELKHGEPRALLELAIDIAAHFAVLPENRSKAERGDRLAAGRPEAPAAAPAPAIDAGLPPIRAFRDLAAGCIDHLLANAEGVRRRDDPEYIHQARVAIRRLRALIKVFSPLLPPAFVVAYGPAWRQLAGLLGDARDRDVLVGETLPAIAQSFEGHDGLERFLEHAMSQRDRARETARKAFLAPEPGRLILGFLGELTRLPEPADDIDLKAFARAQLARRARRVRKDCLQIADFGIEELHRLRIRFKRLRYAVEFFAPLFRRRVPAAYLAQLKAMQESLGRINDLERALALESAAPDAVRSELLAGWLMASQRDAVARLPSAAREFLAERNPWS